MPLSPAIQDYVDRNIITLHQANNLTNGQRRNLESVPVRVLIANRTITLEQALDLTDAQRRNLESVPIRALIADRTITLEQALGLTDAQRRNLEPVPIRSLIADRTITLEQALGLTDGQRTALGYPEARHMLREGTLTIENIRVLDLIIEDNDNPILEVMLAVLAELIIDLIIEDNMRDDPVDHHAQGAAAVVPRINDRQSTHNASAHQAASESATRLARRYQRTIDGVGLENLLSMIQSFANSLSDNSEKNRAAKRFISRIKDTNYNSYTDPASGITIKKLFVLVFLAIADDDNRLGSFPDGMVQFIDGLYEIQRGYNLSDTGIDQGGQDRSICSTGAFNKLIEKLQGIHPDCQIRFITRETASLKLPVVVREEAMRYLKPLSNLNTVQILQGFTQLISTVKEGGVEVIWDQIKDNVADRMFDEFGSKLCRDRTNHSFTGLIDAGKYTELPDLSIFQEQVQNSKGYHQFCNQMLRQSGMFFSHQTSAEYLREHRHDSPEAQQKYDQQFGLVLRNS